MKKKRPLHSGGARPGGGGPPASRPTHTPKTPDAPRGASGPHKKAKARPHAAAAPPPTSPLPPWPALARPAKAHWWPAPADFEAAPEEEEHDEETGGPSGPPPPCPPPLVVADPPGPSTTPAFPCLAGLATTAGPPGGPTAGRAVLAALVHPVSVDTFMSSVFEGRPLLVRGRGPAAAASYARLFSSADLTAWLAGGDVPYGTALDVVRFDGRVRHTLNFNGEGGDGDGDGAAPAAAADPALVASRLAGGCSARVLHPQRRSPRLAAALAALEGFFGCLVGCNAYLTPGGGAQGFAPHADGVGVFILQAEGRKRWRVHGPRSPGEVLPLASSPDFAPGAVGATLLDAVLEAGDLLYLPRGLVHQAETPRDGAGGTGTAGCGQAPNPPPPSLHLTISVSDGLSGGGTWSELLGTGLARALDLAAGRCVGLRRAIPPGVVGSALGVGAEDSSARAEAAAGGPSSSTPPYAARATARAAAQAIAARALAAVVAAFPLDAAADAMAAAFIRRRLPPPPPSGGATPPSPRPAVPPPAVTPIAEGTAGRLVIEGDVAAIYHCLANDVAAHAACGGEGEEGEGDEEERGRLALPLECAPAVEALLGLHSARPGDRVVLADLVEQLGGGEEAEEAVRVAAEAMWGVGLLV